MIVVPQSFLQDPHTEILMKDGLSCVVKKEASAVNPNNDRYVTVHGFTLVQEGELVVTTEHGVTKRVKEGEIIFLPKSLYLISDIIPNKSSFKAIVFFIDDSIIEEFLESFPDSVATGVESENVWVTNDTSGIALFTEALIQLHTGGSTVTNKVTRYKLLELLHLLKNTSNGNGLLEKLTKAKKREKVHIKKFMDMNYAKPLKIEDYAFLTGRSISSFHRDFKRLYKMSPKKWLIDRRLEKAKSRITEDYGTSITEIALSAGYENISNFIKAFNKKYGISPKQYQMHVRESILTK